MSYYFAEGDVEVGVRLRDYADEVQAPSIGSKCRRAFEREYEEPYTGQIEGEVGWANLNTKQKL